MILPILAIGALVAVAFVLLKTAGGDLSFDDLVGLAIAAGFSDTDANTAAAIALAESAGDPKAQGDPNAGVSVGLWQINLAAHPEYRSVDLTDPESNANAAFAVFSSAGNSFNPWTTYRTGAYEKFLQGVTA